MKKILIISPGFAANEKDTSAVPYLQDYLLALRNEIGAENIQIIAIQYPFTQKKYTWNGITVHPMGGKNRSGISRLLTIRKAIKAGMRIGSTANYAIHAFWLSEAAFIGQHIAKKIKAPIVITMMGTDALAKSNLVRFIQFDKVPLIALSQNQAKAFHSATGKQVTQVIPLPFDNTFPEHTAADRDIDILFNGSFIAVKQPELFIEIISEFQKSSPGLKVVMIGDGPLKKWCLQLVNDLGLENVIRFTGTLPRENVFEYMQRSKILLHTSTYEGQCHSFLEAFACGMHVVSFDVGRVEKSNRHIVAPDKTEMIIQLKEVLTSAVTFEPMNFVHGKEIVQTYLNLYSYKK